MFIAGNSLPAGLSESDIDDHYLDYFEIDDGGVFNDNGGTGPFSRPLDASGQGAKFSLSWQSGGAAGTNGLYITYTAVPEPGSVLLAGLGSLAAGWYGRRRLKNAAPAGNDASL